jgi:glycosyltransferase involved in cell wall biosynthesis
MTDMSVVIVTRDRTELVLHAIETTLRQSVQPEIVVVDDGSIDGTAEIVRQEFPQVALFRTPESRGSVAQRTHAAGIARGKIVVSIDDDVAFQSDETLEHTRTEFDHPRIGAVAIPYVEAHEAPRVRQLAPSIGGPYATFRFAGGAHAVRRDLFLWLGGFRSDLVQQGEEADFCLRMLAAGYVTRLGSAPALLHELAPPYDTRRIAYYGRRNDVLYAWRNVPMPYLAGRALKVAARSVEVALRLREPRASLSGTVAGVRSAVHERHLRSPVSREVYGLARRLKSRAAVPLSEIEPLLPPIAAQ